MTWNLPAEDVPKDPNSEVDIASPPLLEYLNDATDLEDSLGFAWGTPALFFRKFDNSKTRPFQDRLDLALDKPPSWISDKELTPLCDVFRGHASSSDCSVKRRIQGG